MAKGPRYRVPIRRRREGKTDYYLRRELLKSDTTRVVIRRSTKNMRVQFIEAKPNGDITRSDSSSHNLTEFGWNLSGGNIPAAYLTGYLAGKKAVQSGIDEGILDLGLQTNQAGSRIYAALKGVIDAGVEIPVNENIFPEDDTIQGQHIVKAGAFYEEQKTYKDVFSRYSKNKVKPADISKLVNKVKSSIDNQF